MSTPYVGFSGNTLAGLQRVKYGDKIICPHCAGLHELERSTSNGKPSDLILFYKCGDTAYMGAAMGRLTMGVKVDCFGSVDLSADVSNLPARNCSRLSSAS